MQKIIQVHPISEHIVSNPMRRSLVMAAVLSGVAVSSAWAAEPIVIGRSLALTGPLKPYGEAKRDGGDAYIEQVNKAGGIRGRPIKLVTLDDEYQADKIVVNLKKLATSEKPIAFLGLFGVPTVAAALPVLLELKIPAVGLTSGAAAVRTPHNEFSFPVIVSYAEEANKIASHINIFNDTATTEIYTDNAFGESVKNNLIDAAKKNALNAVLYKLEPAGKDFASVVANVIADKPQAVVLAMLSQPAIPVIRELKRADSSAFMYAFSPVDTTVIIKELGLQAAGLSISQVMPIPTSTNYLLTAEYATAMKALGRGSPSFYGLEAFLEAKVLVEGLRRADSALSSAGLVKALETMQDWNGGGLYVTYKPGQHSGTNFLEIDHIDANGVLRR